MHPLRSHSFPLPSSCRPGPVAAINNGAIICHSCPHEDSVARPVGKAAIPRDTREDRVYAATVCMRARRYQKSMSEVMQYAAL